MKPTHPLEILFAFGLAGALAAAVAGSFPLAVLLAVAALAALGRRTLCHRARSHRRRPSITYLPAPLADEPLIRLERGQTATAPWPHPLQVLLPEGTRLQILEATPERVRVMAV
jgi:type II secretory pathway pseudopilin PulG